VHPIAQVIRIYSYLLWGRVILSWFPIQRGGAMESIYNVLYTVTEPVLGPIRRAIPPLGGFDLSPIVAFFALQLLAGFF
jgi:YggT family protein